MSGCSDDRNGSRNPRALTAARQRSRSRWRRASAVSAALLARTAWRARHAQLELRRLVQVLEEQPPLFGGERGPIHFLRVAAAQLPIAHLRAGAAATEPRGGQARRRTTAQHIHHR